MSKIRKINGERHPMELAEWLQEHAENAEAAILMVKTKGGGTAVKTANVSAEDATWLLVALQARVLPFVNEEFEGED